MKWPALVLAVVLWWPSLVWAQGVWNRMIPGTFEPSVAAAVRQCEEQERVSVSDRLTPVHCLRLRQHLVANTCDVIPAVADGLRLAFMSERGGILRNVEKRIGRAHRALRCDLGDGVFAYYFTGEPGVRGNNLGLVFTDPPPRGRWSPSDTLQPGVPGFSLPGVYIDRPCNCDLNLQGLYFPGQVPNPATGGAWRCD